MKAGPIAKRDTTLSKWMLEVASVSPRNFREWWDWPVVGIFMQLMCRNKKVSMTRGGLEYETALVKTFL